PAAIPAGTPIGSDILAKLAESGIEDVRVYAERGATSGATETRALIDLTPGQTIAMPAQVQKASEEWNDPQRPEYDTLAAKGDVVTNGLIESFQEASITSVRVTDFRFSQWMWRWYFVLGCAGMLASAMTMRTFARRAAKAATAGESTVLVTYDIATDRLRALATELETVRAGASLDDLAATIIKPLDVVQAGTLFELLEGLSGFQRSEHAYARYAEILEPLAAGERAIYRAWSSAVDEQGQESIESLDRAVTLVNYALDAALA
ncbi:MAG: hypothetical protein AAGB34_10575, partial [Planctomycetota bacterium]